LYWRTMFRAKLHEMSTLDAELRGLLRTFTMFKE